jgi:alkylation response protein AidB-like acyl-CoA dehydrogenase
MTSAPPAGSLPDPAPGFPASPPAGLPPMPARSAEQDQFAASLHDVLGASAPGTTGALAAARGWAAGDHGPGLALWRNLAELGVTALTVPESRGGLGASPMDLVAACEELGHHALPGPVTESLAAVPALLVALGDEGLCERWLPGLAAGDVIATLALPPRVPYALDADVAGLVLLADASAVRLAVAGARHQSVDGTRWLFEVSAGPRLAGGPAVAGACARSLTLGALVTAAQLHGAGRALLEASVTHARQRTQFGQPIGKFQAVQHQLADVAIGLEFARPLLYAAAMALADNATTAARDVSAAKVACADAARRAARTALQVHGAIGYASEHDLGLWLTKVRALIPAWGTPAEHRAQVMAALVTDEESAWN